MVDICKRYNILPDLDKYNFGEQKEISQSLDESVINDLSKVLIPSSNNLTTGNTLQKVIGKEVGAPSNSSPSLGDSMGEWTETVEKAFVDENENLLWMNGKSKGYVSMVVSDKHIDVSFKFISTVKSKEYQVLKTIKFRVEHNKPYKV